jgi:RNA polymerase sigma-32 factor
MGIIPQQQVKLLASKLDVKEKEVEEMSQRLFQNDVSLNAPLSHEEKGEQIQMLADPGMPIDQELGNLEQKELFHNILQKFAKTLKDRELDVFEQRLVSETPLTLQEIGDKYGVTKERARQIEEQIKDKLKKYMQEHYPDYNVLAEDH